METRARIEQVFEEKGVFRGGERYLRVSDARDLIADLVEAERAVVGVEGVELTEEETRPLPEMIADFSERPEDTWTDYVHRCAAQTRAFLDTFPDRETVFVTLTILTRDEWERYSDGEGDHGG